MVYLYLNVILSNKMVKKEKWFVSLLKLLNGSGENIMAFPLGIVTEESFIIITEAIEFNALWKYFGWSTKIRSPFSTLWISLIPVIIRFSFPNEEHSKNLASCLTERELINFTVNDLMLK